MYSWESRQKVLREAEGGVDRDKTGFPWLVAPRRAPYDPYWRYSAGDKGLLGCDDIAAEPEKIEKRCRTQERVGVDATGREVRASVACKGVCRESCEGC